MSSKQTPRVTGARKARVAAERAYGEAQRLVAETIAEDGSPERQAELVELKELMRQMLHDLTLREVKVLVCLYEEDLSIEECTRELGISRTRVAKLEQTALRKIREAKRQADLLEEYVDGVDVLAIEVRVRAFKPWKK